MRTSSGRFLGPEIEREATRARQRHQLLMGGVLLLMALASTSAVVAASTRPQAEASHDLATLSVPSPRWFWDSNNDGTPDDSGVSIDATGGGWTSTKLDRLNAAAATWKNNTDFDPGRDTNSTHEFYVDGSVPWCETSWDPNVLQETCQTWQTHYYQQDPTEVHYYRILDKDTYTNTGDWSWWYGSTHTGAENVADWQGVATHEIGHWVRLQHVPLASCAPGVDIETMCQTVRDVDDDTWRFRSLTSDDITSANTVYP